MTAVTGTSNGTGLDVERKTIVSTSPATGRKLGEVPVTTPQEITAMMARARAAQPRWFRSGLGHRMNILRDMRTALVNNLDRIIASLVAEQGKVPFEALCEYWPAVELGAVYLRNAANALKPKNIFIGLSPHQMHWVERRPFGVVLIIAPWNFPVLLSFAPIMSALITGNTVIYKPSEYATQTGLEIARVVKEAGVPDDVFQIAQGAGDVGAALVQAKPDKISFTGSVATGRKIAAAAGQLLIPCTLELGAKDAAIVLEDADLDRAAVGIVWGALHNAGQACLSIEQVYAARSVVEPLTAKMKAAIDKYIKVGPGEAVGTTMGALITPAQLKIVESQVNDAIDKGAQVVTGGQPLSEGNGQFYPPTILTNITPEMRLMKDETFGPIIPVLPFDDVSEVIERVNQSVYGLTGSVWTRNRRRGMEIMSQLEVGHASVNEHIVSASLPNLPWGGVKDSGYGSTRGIEGLLEMTRPQSFSVERLFLLPIEYFWYPYTPFKYNFLRRFIKFLYAPTLLEKIRILLGR